MRGLGVSFALIDFALPSRDTHQRHASFRRVRIDPPTILGRVAS